MKIRKMKSPFRWLLLIPAQLLLSMILFNLTVGLDLALFEQRRKEREAQGITVGGHPGPGFSIFGFEFGLMFMFIAFIAAIVLTLVSLLWRLVWENMLKKSYVRDMELHIPSEKAEWEVQSFLRKRVWPMQSGFYPTVWKRQKCFCADMFFTKAETGRSLPGKYFFGYCYRKGILHMEAWMCVIRENGSFGKVYAAQPPYLNMLAGFEAYLAEKYQTDQELHGKKKKRALNGWAIALIVLALGAGLSLLVYPYNFIRG